MYVFKRFNRSLAVMVVLGACLAPGPHDPASAEPVVESSPSPYPPTDRYEARRVEGWPVLVNKDLIRNKPELAERTLVLLRHQLFQVVRRVPAKAVERLRKIQIWVEENESHTPCMAYHPDATWLREHGMNPEKAGCVELANARNFLSWTIEQPWMVLHELAHGYHHQFLNQGFDNDEIKAVYEQAKAAQIYQSVLRINGKDDKAYAATNPMEYFAETSEAFFGTNDFYPYVRSELQRHDPKMFGLLETLWGSE
ncbi:hypothetical protein SAMN05444166_3542 [Singulisphaera sp. GP187]|uniref:hypothetical protein n=1 Tax=Singulisphaera sp. GP187 TaxID=1882752 RepID=UPI000927C72F|nr:hypothetical protein [Singulisphaera sp. GP187]SIO29150.1 hypothetical protein SAMN05444166_3542 [Singulisphaera sp. GP187]